MLSKRYQSPMVSIAVIVVVGILLLILSWKLLKAVVRTAVTFLLLGAIAGALWLYRAPLLDIYQQITGG